jgi:hypothetical protein
MRDNVYLFRLGLRHDMFYGFLEQQRIGLIAPPRVGIAKKDLYPPAYEGIGYSPPEPDIACPIMGDNPVYQHYRVL